MKKYVFFLASLFFLLYCCSTATSQLDKWEPYDESEELAANATHAVSRMQYKRIQSKHSDRNALFLPFEKELTQFTQTEYEALKNLILEQDILSIQGSIGNGSLTYESLTLFYLYRIYYFELQRETYLNAIIALNPNVLKEAREKDRKRKADITHPIYGMPILLKDNINALPMATTAGAAAFRENTPQRDAFLVKQLKAKGALILGKVNLSEWAYYFCQGCPLGYSAMGGQTLNPYGRKQFETGGSSSGSGVAVAANYTVAAIGSETSGSILSPSGKNSVVGLKPTIGVISRSGVVPISSNLDTAGPMTKNVLDTAILMHALVAIDFEDSYSFKSTPISYQNLASTSLKGKRFGLIQSFKDDRLMQQAVLKVKEAGAEVITFDPPEVAMDQFRKLLDVDMKADLPKYIEKHASKSLALDLVRDIVAFNRKDSLLHAPYGQGIFLRIVEETLSQEEFSKTKNTLMINAKRYFEEPMKAHDLDAILSIDNRKASYAAAAHYPALGVPMGFTPKGQPQNLTLITPSKTEQRLLELGAAIERLLQARKTPELFK